MADTKSNTPASEAPKAKASDLEATIKLIRETFVSEPINQQNGSQVVFTANGLQRHEIVALNPTLPSDIAGALTFIEPASLIGYTNKYKRASALCLAYPGALAFIVRLDYHEPNERGPNGETLVDAAPATNKHTAQLDTPYDPDYAKWKQVFGTLIPQEAFATFIEDMAHTVITPDAGRLQEIVLDLQVHRNVAFKSAINQRDGTAKLQFEEEDNGGATSHSDIILPSSIVLTMPVFQGGPPIEITAKLRYRLERGVLRFLIVPPGLEKIERDEFVAIGDAIKDACDIPVFYSADR